MSEGKTQNMVRCGDLLITHFAVFDLSKITEIPLTEFRTGMSLFEGYEVDYKTLFQIARSWAEWKKEGLNGGPNKNVYCAAENILDSMEREKGKAQ